MSLLDSLRNRLERRQKTLQANKKAGASSSTPKPTTPAELLQSGIWSKEVADRALESIQEKDKSSSPKKQ